MKQNANLIRPGWVIEHNGRPWSVIKSTLFNQVKVGPLSLWKCEMYIPEQKLMNVGEPLIPSKN